MEKSTLVKICKTLSSKDVRDLRKFVRSPYFNQRADVILLFDYLAEQIQAKDPDWNKEIAFSRVYPQETIYQDSLVRYAMSFLLKVLKKYFIYTEITEDTATTEIHYCRVLRRKGLGELFEKEWKKAWDKQNKQQYRNTKFHYDNYQFHLERYEYIHRQNRSGQMNLQELSDELTTFYIADFLRQSCSILSHITMSQKDYDLNAINEVLQVVEKNNLSTIPAIAIYYHSYCALSNLENEQNFHQLKKLIANHWQKFPLAEIRDIYLLAINYCIKRLNSGYQSFIREGFELYRAALTDKVLLENGLLSIFTYNNILRLGMALREVNWVENFLDTYKSFLDPKQRENVYRYNLAVFYFRKPDYEKAMQLLRHVEFKDVLYNLDARRMLLKMYYESETLDALESLLDSFRIYISRLDGYAYHKENYRNLIRFVRKYLKSDLSDTDTKEQLRLEIEQTKSLAEREWLLERL